MHPVRKFPGHFAGAFIPRVGADGLVEVLVIDVLPIQYREADKKLKMLKVQTKMPGGCAENLEENANLPLALARELRDEIAECGDFRVEVGEQIFQRFKPGRSPNEPKHQQSFYHVVHHGELRTEDKVEDEGDEVLLQYENRVEVLPIKPPLTGWQRSVVQDGPAIAIRWQKTIEHALTQHRSSVPADLVVGIMLTESMGKPRAKNPSGAAGLLGVKPIVCKELRVRRCDLFNPHRNISLGIQYLRLLQKYGFKDEKLILAYGVGPTRAREILKTRKLSARHSRYVQKVLYARKMGKTYLANT